MTVSINFDALFDADQLHRSGECPWTFFAFPTSLADSRGLPPDDDAEKLLAELQSRGIPIAIWRNGIAQDTTYFACRYADRLLVDKTLAELENRGMLEQNFLSTLSDYLFSLVDSSTKQPDLP